MIRIKAGRGRPATVGPSRPTGTEAFRMAAASEKADAPVAGGEALEVRVRERAYAIRERGECPEGAAEWHRLLAEAELREPAPASST